MSLTIETSDANGNTLIKVFGEVDLYSSPDLRSAIGKAIQQNAQGVAVQLTDVGYMDSSGVATLVEGLRAAMEKNKTFMLVAPSQAVMKVLQLSRLDSVFDIRESL